VGAGTSAVPITAATAAANIGTFTAAGHGCVVGDVVVIAGVTPAGYNGTWLVVGVTSSSIFQVQLATTPTAGSAFGTSTRSILAQGHVLTDDLTTDYLTIEQDLADAPIERFLDCVIAELVWSVDPSSHAIRLAGTWFGCASAWQASPTAKSFESATPFVLADGVFTIDGNAAVTNLRSFTITQRFIYEGPVTNDVVPQYQVKLRQEVELSISQLIIDPNAEYRLVHYGSTGGTTYPTRPVTGSFVGTFIQGSGTSTRQMKLEIPNLAYGNAQYTPLSPDGAVEEVTRPAKGVWNGTDPMFRPTFTTADTPAYV
jgi:hypothetical protein